MTKQQMKKGQELLELIKVTSEGLIKLQKWREESDKKVQTRRPGHHHGQTRFPLTGELIQPENNTGNVVPP